jgi:hypothetical protein
VINFLKDSFDNSLNITDLRKFFISFASNQWNSVTADMYLNKLINSSLMPGLFYFPNFISFLIINRISNYIYSQNNIFKDFLIAF